MANDNLRFAIIGTGTIAQFHAQAIRDAEGAELVAVYNRRPEAAASFAQEHDIQPFTDLAALLAAEIDAVTVATPTGAHAEVAVPAAAAGKHILCEKPLEVTPAKADRIIAACAANKVTLAAIFQSRFSENARKIKQAIEAGRFGKLLLASAQMKWFRTQEYYDSGAWRGTWELDGGGCLMNQGIHTIDLLVHLAGEAVEVCAYTGTFTHSGIEVEDNACAIVKFKNGALGTIEGSTSCAPGFPRRIEISGEHGSVVLEGDDLVRWQFTTDQEGDEEIRQAAARVETKIGGAAADPKAISHAGHTRHVEDLVAAVRAGREPFIPGREARQAIAVICGIYESARTGKPYKLA